MKKDKNGAIHDSSGRFAPKAKPTYMKILFTDKIDIAVLVLVFLLMGKIIDTYIAPNALATFKALAALWQ